MGISSSSSFYGPFPCMHFNWLLADGCSQRVMSVARFEAYFCGCMPFLTPATVISCAPSLCWERHTRYSSRGMDIRVSFSSVPTTTRAPPTLLHYLWRFDFKETFSHMGCLLQTGSNLPYHGRVNQSSTKGKSERREEMSGRDREFVQLLPGIWKCRAFLLWPSLHLGSFWWSKKPDKIVRLGKLC